MTPVEAKYRRDFTIGKTRVTAKEKVASLLDDNWMYSWNWPNDGDLWIDKAKEDVDAAMAYVKARIASLEKAKAILEDIEVEV